MSIDNAEKIKLIRESERLNRRQFSDLTEIPYSSLSAYEGGVKEMSMGALKKMLNHPRLKKYALWFMTDEIAPESGQIAPVLAHYGQGSITLPHSGQKIG